MKKTKGVSTRKSGAKSGACGAAGAGDKPEPAFVSVEDASMGRLQFELLRRAIARTHADIVRTEKVLEDLRAREKRQCLELAVQFTRLEKAGERA